jgi:2-C-methyl-D-erythritol 4-phosphate cytidylyltransferase
MNIALIIAGGKGERTKQEIPKQFIHDAIKYSLFQVQNMDRRLLLSFVLRLFLKALMGILPMKKFREKNYLKSRRLKYTA